MPGRFNGWVVVVFSVSFGSDFLGSFSEGPSNLLSLSGPSFWDAVSDMLPLDAAFLAAACVKPSEALSEGG